MCPAGVHVARCIKVIDLGTQYNKKFDKWQRKVMLTFELPHALIPDGDLKGQPFASSVFQTVSMNPKANLRAMLESWRGRAFSDKEAEEFDIIKLAGVPAFVNIIHEDHEGNTYANIKAVMPLPTGTTCPPAINPIQVFELVEFKQEAFDALSDKLKERIKGSKEYQRITGQGQPESENTGAYGFDVNEDVPF
jgi:hypothetical protein